MARSSGNGGANDAISSARNTAPRSAQSVRGVAIVTFISAIFGLFWGLTAIAGLPAPFESPGRGLVLAFDSRWFAVIGGAMCLIGVLSLGLPVHLRIDGGLIAVRDTVVGVGCAFVLWISVSTVAIPTWRDVK